MSVTLVTSVINYYFSPLEKSTKQKRIECLRKIIDLRVPMIIFVSTEFIQDISELSKNSDPIYIIHLKNHVQHSFLKKYNINKNVNLPENRLIPKDTIEYLCYSHSKIDFLNIAIEQNPFQTNHFAWIDFDISKLIKREKTWNLLKHLCHHGLEKVSVTPDTEHKEGKQLLLEDEIYIPSCWNFNKKSIKRLCDTVCWRFCTNFFVGRNEAIKKLKILYNTHLHKFTTKENCLTWDMNFFAYLEQETNWSPISYKGNHDDSLILNFPLFSISKRLLEVSSIIEEKYPQEKDYYPTSCSVCIFKNEGITRKIMNVRYVNYYYLPSGHCNTFNHVCTKNKCAYLNEENKTLNRMFWNIQDSASVMGLPEPDPTERFQGVEDIRLFAIDSKIKFIATSVNFSNCGNNRIMIGDYDINSYNLKNCFILESPFSKKEKNWIPFIPKDKNELLVIYNWTPFQLGKIIDNKKLDIFETFKIDVPYSECLRGSTNVIFDEDDKCYKALVHISIENTLPRQYYHMMVCLDQFTYKPFSFSKLFHFDNFGVEFCLSMAKTNENFLFWISRKDRDPLCLRVNGKEFEKQFGFIN